MNIKKIILSDDQVKVDYSTDAGEYKINLSGDLASLDLTKSIARLADIFASRLKLDDLRHKPMTLPSGVDTGNDDSGDWYRVHGTYTANNITYKLQTGKMRETKHELREDQEPEDYPYLLTDEELDLVQDAFLEATLFVEGKRKQDPQMELFDEITSNAVDAFDSLINEVKGQGATVSMGGVEL